MYNFHQEASVSFLKLCIAERQILASEDTDPITYRKGMQFRQHHDYIYF